MSYAAHRTDFAPIVGRASARTNSAPKRRSILLRIFDTFMEARQRDADQRIANFLAVRSAERLTDELEREMFQRLSTSNWSANASAYAERRFP